MVQNSTETNIAKCSSAKKESKDAQREATLLANPDHKFQLDSLRGLAVIAVFIDHLIFLPLHIHIPFGSWGVRLFFVLSGYLITGILLKNKEKATQRGFSQNVVLKGFYARRFLRIFPLYYVCLFILFAVGYQDVRESFGWLLTYTSNIYMGLYGQWPWPVSHFWSLAVEEQFYLFWPFVVLFIPNRFLLAAFAVLITTGPVFRMLSPSINPNEMYQWFMTPSHLDSLGIGALWAFCEYKNFPVLQKLFASAKRSPFVYLLATTFAFRAFVFFSNPLSDIYNMSTWVNLNATIEALFFLSLIALASKGIGGRFGKFLDSEKLQEVGKYSYAIYLSHELFDNAYLDLLRPHVSNTLVLSGIVMVLTLPSTWYFSKLSWKYFEGPLNNYKSHFPYVPKAKTAKPAVKPDLELAAQAN